MSNQLLNQKKKAGYQRYRTLARSLAARIFATAEGRLFLVSGMPDFERLCSGLSRVREVTSPVQAPTPSDLGFATFCDGELTEHCLHVRSRALTRWFRALDDQSRQRARRQRAQQIASEAAEIRRLRQRLTDLHELRRRLVAGENPPDAPYVLDREGGRQLAALLENHVGEHPLTKRTAYVARIAFWIAGPPATSRYLQAIKPLSLPADQISRVGHLRKFRQRLYVWKQRSANEHWRAIHSELKAAVQALPREVVNEAGLTSRLRHKTLPEHCELLIARCTTALGALQDNAIYRVPSEIAALVACDGGAAELPARLIERFASDGDYGAFRRAICAMYHECGKPGYNELLWALGRLPELPELAHFETVRELRAADVSLQDIDWAQQQNLLRWFDRPILRPGWARAFTTALRDGGITLNRDELTDVLYAVRKPGDLRLLDQWAKWLRLLTPATITPKVRNLLVKSLLEQIVPSMTGLGCSAQLHRLLQPPARRCPGVVASCDGWPALAPWLHRIGHYQRISRQGVRTPKSVRKHLETAARLYQERRHLRDLQRRGLANDKQAARLRYLDERSDTSDRAAQSRSLRDAETVYVMTAIDAIRTVLHDVAMDRWQRVVGFALPQELAPWAVEMAQWARRMDEAQRRTLADILRAWTDHGDAYKSHLNANATWIDQAVSRDVDLPQWFSPESWRIQVGHREVTIGVSRQPCRTFLMGSLFNTCLSFGGCNEMSLLANAYDANKQVVYMWDARGKMLARQLTAISADFKLLGYHCYSVAGNDKQEARDEIIGRMASYCGRWARRCGIALADDGEPVAIGDHFWYDDGTWDWHAAGKASWADQNQRLEQPLPNLPPAITTAPALA